MLWLILSLCAAVLFVLIFLDHTMTVEATVTDFEVRIFFSFYLFSKLKLARLSIYNLINRIIKAKKKRKKHKKRNKWVRFVTRIPLDITLDVLIPTKDLNMSASAQLAALLYVVDMLNKVSVSTIKANYRYGFDAFFIHGIISFRIWDIMKAAAKNAIISLHKRYAG